MVKMSKMEQSDGRFTPSIFDILTIFEINLTPYFKGGQFFAPTQFDPLEIFWHLGDAKNTGFSGDANKNGILFCIFLTSCFSGDAKDVCFSGDAKNTCFSGDAKNKWHLVFHVFDILFFR